MGNAVKVEVLPEQESVVNPGGDKVILSASMDDIEGVNFINFVNELMFYMKSPPPMTEYVTKEQTYEEVPPGNPDEFKVKVVLDGEKLKSYGFGDGTDSVVMNRHVKVNRAERRMECWDYVSKENPDKPSSRSVTHFLEDPFRIEAYLVSYDAENPDGVRTADEQCVRIWKDLFIDPICTTLKYTKVKCTPDQPSINGSGDGELAVVSDRLDSFCQQEAFMGAIIPTMKDSIIQVAGEEATVEENDDGTIHTFSVSFQASNPIDPSADKHEIKNKVSLNKETCELREESTVGEIHFRTRVLKIVWPRVESYLSGADAERFTGGNYTRDFSSLVNTIVAAAESQGGWFGSMFG